MFEITFDQIKRENHFRKWDFRSIKMNFEIIEWFLEFILNCILSNFIFVLMSNLFRNSRIEFFNVSVSEFNFRTVIFLNRNNNFLLFFNFLLSNSLFRLINFLRNFNFFLFIKFFLNISISQF